MSNAARTTATGDDLLTVPDGDVGEIGAGAVVAGEAAHHSVPPPVPPIEAIEIELALLWSDRWPPSSPP